MGSNKSKGVEFRNELQNRVESLLYDTLNQDFRNRKDVCKALQDIVDEALAHPPQSEGVEEPYNNPFYDNFYEGITAEEQAETDRRLISKAEGVGATDSICGDLKDRQAAEGLSDTEIADLWERHGMFGSYDGFVSAIKEVTMPSEPAALKEFYCIGDKDNLFQCEEQCEDCKKGAALKDGEIKKVIERLWEKRTGGSLSAYRMSYAKFYEALKEFASLLTNHKS